MKRFHIHVSVGNLQKSIDFYTSLFGQEPGKVHEDYARWMLDDPFINFAISARGHTLGVNHLGFQVDNEVELESMREMAVQATGDQVIDDNNASCCYANSNKYWTMDPQGLAWEHFTTLADVPTFGDDATNQSGACCVPFNSKAEDSGSQAGACCVPADSSDCC